MFELGQYVFRKETIIVGVPSRQSPNAFMEVTPFTLPESGLQGSISNAVQYMLPEAPAAMVLRPDHPITAEQFRNRGGDLETPPRFALELIAAGR